MATSINEDCTMEIALKNIYTSCDPDNSNLVPVSKLIDFITPYMLEDLSVLESLRDALDPQNSNVCVSSEKFYEVMNEWTKKFFVNTSDDNADFNRTPSQLDVLDDKQLPYTQSTPRASFGQKLLNCEGLLNLSNVSSYSLSTSMQSKETNTVGAEKTILEEEVKRLEHLLNRVSNEMMMVKLHLTATEEQNEILQADLDRCKTRLHSEQQIIEHLQNDKRYNDELREELNSSKKQVEELNRKVIQYEKDNNYLQSLVEKSDKENAKLEQKCEELSRREKEAKKQIIDIKTELDLKDQEITTILKINEELKLKLEQQRDLIDQLTNENELLDHQKNSLEKALRDTSARRDSIVSHYKTCLADSSSFPNLGTIPIYSSPNQKYLYNNPEFFEKVSSPVSPIFTIKKEENLLHKVLKSSTPKALQKPLLNISISKERLGLPILNPMQSESNSLHFFTFSHPLPTMYYIERSNVVQDQSSEEEYYFKIQETDSKSFPHESLQTEISQISFNKDKVDHGLISFEKNENLIEFDGQNKDFNNTEHYLEDINELRIKNSDIQSKLEIVNKNNEMLTLEITTMRDKILVLEQDISNILIEKKMKEENLEQIQIEKNKVENELIELKKKNSMLKDENNNLFENNKSINNTLKLKNKIMTELEEKLLELKQEFTNLQIENISKEKELDVYRSKFNFECAFKHLQIEINEKNKENLELRNSKEQLQELLDEKINENESLQKFKMQTELKLKEKEDESRQMTVINENIEQTANQVQVYINRKNAMITELVELNKKFEQNTSKLQKDLQDKIIEVTKLRDSLKSDTEIKNIMWRDNKELKLKLETEHKTNKKLLEDIHEIQQKIKANNEEYNILLAKYNLEVDKNCELCAQNVKQKKELSSAVDKYNQELNKNQILYEKVSTFKNEIEIIKESQNECKTKVNNELSCHEALIKKLEVNLQELRVQNDALKVELESEKKSKKEKFFDVDITTSESTKNMSFDKQIMKIDRLKEKLEITEGQLQNEKMKNDQLRKILNEKDDMEEKYTKVQLEFKQAESKTDLEKQELQHVIEDLSEKLKCQKENYTKLENLVNEKETVFSLKLSQMEQQNQHLYAEVNNKDCIINNICLEIERFKNADKIAQELSANMRARLFELNAKEKEIQRLNAEVVKKHNSILSLSAKIAEQEIKLSKVLDDLIANKNINIILEKECKSLQEKLEKFNNLEEKELTDNQQKLKSTCRLLQCSEMELNLIGKKLADAKTEFDCITKKICEHKNIISHGSFELSRAIALVLSKWEDELLRDDDIYKELLIVEECEQEDNLSGLNDKIKLAVSLLEMLASRAPIPMEESEYCLSGLINIDNNTDHYSLSSDGKTIKKFTLRPPRLLISRPASPDSPSIDINEINKTNYNEIASTLKKRHINESSDRCNSQDFSFNNDESYTTTCDELSFCQFPDHFELTPFQDSFLNVSDIFLEKEGLHESSPKKKLTKEETEELFTTFAIQIVLDSKDIKERLQKQGDRCTEQHEKFLSLIKDISTRLRDHKCIGAADPINPVFVLLEDMKYLLRDIAQSTGQFGVLTCENRMMKCWNLVTNYMALLKQKTTNLESSQSRILSEGKERTTDNLDDSLRKRLKNPKKKEGKNSKTQVLIDDDAEVNLRWCKFIPSCRFSITIGIFLVFFILLLLLSIHWQCRMTTSESKVCILDDFIKKIQIGNPPY